MCDDFKVLAKVATGKTLEDGGVWRQYRVTYRMWVAVALPCGRYEDVTRLEWEFEG